MNVDLLVQSHGRGFQVEQSSDVPPLDLGLPEYAEQFIRCVNAVWPKSRWHSIEGFTKVLQIYCNYTTGDSPTAQLNRYLLGFWQVSERRICYCLSKLKQRLGRSRSSINAAFMSWRWFVRPLSEEEEWRPALQSAVPHLLLNPCEMRMWTIRGLSLSEHTSDSSEIADVSESSPIRSDSQSTNIFDKKA
jgi:hypothetical protein